MKIITRFESLWDEAQKRYVTVKEESFDYDGPLTLCDMGGGSTTTVTNTVPPKTETELAADALTLKQLQRQDAQAEVFDPIIKQYIEDLGAEQKIRKESGVTPEMRSAQEKEDFERSRRMAKVEEELSTLQLEQIKHGGKPTPEQIALIDQATGAAQKTGEADIERFRTATLRQINEEVASASGLRPTDTPVVRLSERAGEEATRQQGILTSRLAETNATARLNFPLASSKLTSDIALGQQSLDVAAQNFQSQLTQRAQDNRFRLFQGGQSYNLNPISFGSSLANERIAAKSSESEKNKQLGLQDYAKIVGSIGGAMRAFSDRRLKRDILRVGELLPGVGWYSYHYLWDDAASPLRHGVMADELEHVMPDAVIYGAEGHAIVDYGKLFIGTIRH